MSQEGVGWWEMDFTSSQPSKVIFIFHDVTHFAWNMNEVVLTFIPFVGAVLPPDVACPRYFLILYPFKSLLYSIWPGVINIPAVALGMFSGGVVMKKYKLGIMGAAKFAFGTSLLGYFLSLFFLAMGCENSKVAGITVSYSGYVTSGHISLMSLGKLCNELLQLTRFSEFLSCCLSLSLFSYPVRCGSSFDQFFKWAVNNIYAFASCCHMQSGRLVSSGAISLLWL